MVQAYADQSVLMDFFDAPYIIVMHRDQEQAMELKVYLERQGFQVDLAHSGEEVYHLIYDLHPDLLILDLVMPDIDSLELCQQIKQDRRLGYLPVIMMTETQEENQRLAGMLSGADEYLSKPVVHKELLLRVQALMWNKQRIDNLLEQKKNLADSLATRDAELKEARLIANQVKMLQRHFIHNVNHELRTPLLQIKSSISMLSDIIRSAVSNKQAHTLAEMATQATARLEGVVQNITQLEVFENTRREPMVLKYAISAATKHFHRSWSHQEDTKRIQTYLGVDLPPVIGDQRAVTRILIALIENALKFSEPVQNVEISIRWLREDNVAWVGVKDYGIGIPEDKLEEIFEPFTQLDMGSTREYGGLGVGLTIAQMLARGMGTQIHVNSSVDEGSLFWFVMPILEDFEQE